MADYIDYGGVDNTIDEYSWGDGSGRAEQIAAEQLNAQLISQYSDDEARNQEIDRILNSANNPNSSDVINMTNESIMNNQVYKDSHAIPVDNTIVDYSDGNGGYNYKEMPWNQPDGGVLTGSYSGGWKDPIQAKARIEQMADLGTYLRSDTIEAVNRAKNVRTRGNVRKANDAVKSLSAWDNNASTYENLYKMDLIQNSINKNEKETLEAVQYVNNLPELKWNKTESVKDESKQKESIKDLDFLKTKLKQIGTTQSRIKEETEFTPKNLALLNKYEALSNKIYKDDKSKKAALNEFIEKNAPQSMKDKKYDILTTTAKNLENAFGKNLGENSLDELYKGDYLSKLNDLSKKRNKISTANNRIDADNKEKLKAQEEASINSTISKWDGSMKDVTTPIGMNKMIDNIKQNKKDAIRNIKDKPRGVQLKALKAIDNKYNLDLQRIQNSANALKVKKKAKDELNLWKHKKIYEAKIDVTKKKQVKEMENGLIEDGYTDKMASDIVKAAAAADMSVKEYMNRMAEVKGYSR